MMLPQYKFYALVRSPAQARLCLSLGITWIQYRNKNAFPGRVYLDCKDIMEDIQNHPEVVFIVNDYPDVALLLGAQGTHLGKGDPMVSRVRATSDPDFLIGLSIDDPQEALQGVEMGASYISAGAIFPSATKESAFLMGLYGLDGILALKLPVPLAVIGGITLNRLPHLLNKPIDMFCCAHDFWESPDPKIWWASYKEIVSRGIDNEKK